MTAITLEQAAQILREHDNYLVLMHKSPDGDAVGSAYALCRALRSIGKKANPLCGDEIPESYFFITDGFEIQDFAPEYIISVDLATADLLSGTAKDYADRIDLCIDHHGSNTGYAKLSAVDGKSPSCAEIIKKLIDVMGIKADREIADAIFTGVCTDTGCFKYSSVRPETHRIAADLMDCGARSAMICRLMFDSKSPAKFDMERRVLDTLEYAAGGKIAFICISREIMERSGATQGDTEGVASIPRQIEGVRVGITMKEKENGEYRFSVRADDDTDASEICRKFGGGGHRAAAGCSIYADSPEKAKDLMIAACIEAIGEDS